MAIQDREILPTLTFTAKSVAGARDRLSEEFDTDIVIEPVSSGFYKWAGKFARAWGTMLDQGPDGTFVEVTRGRKLDPHDTRELDELANLQTKLAKAIREAGVEYTPDSVDTSDMREVGIPEPLMRVVGAIANSSHTGTTYRTAYSMVLDVLRLAAEDSDVRAGINNAATTIRLDREE